MEIYAKEFSTEQGKYLVHAVFNGGCSSFSSTDDYCIGSTCVCNDGVMIKYANNAWRKYEG